MTREEAIKVLQNEVNCAQNDRCSLGCDSCEFFVTDDQVQTAHETAISALQKQGNKRNEPLTLDELLQMNGEPVWIVWPDGRIKSKWWIVNSGCWMDMFWDDHGNISNDYGTVWAAYRQKPEEKEHGV